MGLVILVAMGLYLLISIGVVMWAASYARRHGKSATRWGWSAALVMYLIPFWDWLPTVATHQYYCATESGFWVYKTPDEWKAENPGVLETLVNRRGDPSSDTGDTENFTITHHWNERFNSVFKRKGPFFFSIWQWDQEIVDVKTGEILSRRVDFSMGNGHIGGEPELRFWMHKDGCRDSENQAISFVKFAKQFKGAEK